MTKSNVLFKKLWNVIRSLIVLTYVIISKYKMKTMKSMKALNNKIFVTSFF